MATNKLALLVSLTRRDIEKRYKDSVGGAAWGVFVPLVMLGIYTVIFSTIFGARWGGLEVGSRVDYAILLFIGLIVYTIFAEAITRAPSLILANPNLVKKVVFPLEVLPGVTVASCLYSAMMSSAALFVFLLFSSFGIHWEIIALPVLLVPFLMLTLGVVYLFAALGVFFRDIDQGAALLARVLQYLTPVLYPSTIFPDAIGSWMRLSPLAVFVEQIRALIAFGTWPEPSRYLWACAWSVLIFVIGWAFFRRTRKAFADVV